MESLTQPTLLLKPFADEGDRNDIPVVNNNYSNPQLADLKNGFPEITSRLPSQGGLPPERKDFNALGYLTTSYDYYYQAGGTFTFNQIICNAIGGYPVGARLWYTNPDGVSCIVMSTVANNTNNFITNPNYIGAAGSGKPWVISNFTGEKSQYNILEYKYSDHILNDISWLRSDTFSWQSAAVYTAAYQHLVDDIQGKQLQTKVFYDSSNIISYGYVVDCNGVLSNFLTNTNYATHSAKKPTTSFTYVVKFKPNSLIANINMLEATAQYKGLILRIVNASTGQVNFYLGGGSSWAISNVNTNCPAVANEWNWYKIEWDGSTVTVAKSMDGVNYTVGYTNATAVAVDWDTNLTQGLGGAGWESYPFTNGEIDLNECYLDIDGARYWTGCNYNELGYYQADDGHIITTPEYENMVMRLHTDNYAGWFFVLDTVNERFKLPRDVSLHGNIYKSYRDASGGFRLYEDGWIEQWGFFGTTFSSWTTRYVILYEEMENTSYYVSTVTGNTTHTDAPSVNVKTRGSFDCTTYNSSGNSNWYVCGYAKNKPENVDFQKRYLYFFVGNYNRPALEQTAGVTSEVLNGKMDNDRIQQVDELPENPVSNVLYLIPE